MKTGIVIQARMGSTRLPQKVLLPLRGKTVLEWGVERMRQVAGADEVIVATTVLPEDDAIVDLCKSRKIPVTRGSDWNVLSRYVAAAHEHELDLIVRITSDCPLISPELTDNVISAFKRANGDVAANVIDRKFPRGFDVEVLRVTCLESLLARNPEKFYCEHVTPFFYEHPEIFKLESVVAQGDLARPDIRICLDTQEDYELLKLIFQSLQDPLTATARDIVGLFQTHPDWVTMNAGVAHLKQGGKS